MTRTLICFAVGLALGGAAGYFARGGPPAPGVVAAPANGELCRIARVVDGDTVVLESGLHVRYVGADTPEMYEFKRSPHPFAEEALAMNRRLVEGKQVRLDFGAEKLDVHGRLLARVRVAGEDGRELAVEDELVRAGLALASVTRQGPARDERMLAVEEAARKACAGIWGQVPGRYGITDDPSAPYVASRMSNVYHSAACRAAAKIGPENLIRFATAADAEKLGRRPCAFCGSPRESPPPEP